MCNIQQSNGKCNVVTKVDMLTFCYFSFFIYTLYINIFCVYPLKYDESYFIVHFLLQGIGSFVVGILSDIYGKKKCLKVLFSLLIFLLIFIFVIVSPSVFLFNDNAQNGKNQDRGRLYYHLDDHKNEIHSIGPIQHYTYFVNKDIYEVTNQGRVGQMIPNSLCPFREGSTNHLVHNIKHKKWKHKIENAKCGCSSGERSLGYMNIGEDKTLTYDSFVYKRVSSKGHPSSYHYTGYEENGIRSKNRYDDVSNYCSMANSSNSYNTVCYYKPICLASFEDMPKMANSWTSQEWYLIGRGSNHKDAKMGSNLYESEFCGRTDKIVKRKRTSFPFVELCQKLTGHIIIYGWKKYKLPLMEKNISGMITTCAMNILRRSSLDIKNFLLKINHINAVKKQKILFKKGSNLFNNINEREANVLAKKIHYDVKTYQWEVLSTQVGRIGTNSTYGEDEKKEEEKMYSNKMEELRKEAEKHENYSQSFWNGIFYALMYVCGFFAKGLSNILCITIIENVKVSHRTKSICLILIIENCSQFVLRFLLFVRGLTNVYFIYRVNVLVCAVLSIVIVALLNMSIWDVDTNMMEKQREHLKMLCNIWGKHRVEASHCVGYVNPRNSRLQWQKIPQKKKNIFSIRTKGFNYTYEKRAVGEVLLDVKTSGEKEKKCDVCVEEVLLPQKGDVAYFPDIIIQKDNVPYEVCKLGGRCATCDVWDIPNIGTQNEKTSFIKKLRTKDEFIQYRENVQRGDTFNVSSSIDYSVLYDTYFRHFLLHLCDKRVVPPHYKTVDQCLCCANCVKWSPCEEVTV
ncbi:transporter, putative [Plasmodium ovale curtisi]|uniref:Transporter, putative n=1 Tax=Plasmodium ovale curtisi TaxID=864141 RepID=A0A1A8WZJ9_PLAOA|nr:transporter, putative [Plasmodium ovale curtisi]SBS97303.1 transporter, putative [Plasmodium ovale curtisi]